MKIGYLKSIFLILCVTTMQSAQCDSFAETLEIVTYSYTNLDIDESVSLTLPNGKGTVSGNAIVNKLLKLPTFSEDWVKSKNNRGQMPLEIIAMAVNSRAKNEKMVAFLSSMIKKLLDSGASQTLSVFEECAAHPACGLAFVEKCGLAVLQEEKESDIGEKCSAITIIIDKMKNDYGNYEAVLDKMLKKQGYSVEPRLLEDLKSSIETLDPEFGIPGASLLREAYIKILHRILLHGKLAKEGVDYDPVLKELLNVARSIDNTELVHAVLAQQAEKYKDALQDVIHKALEKASGELSKLPPKEVKEIMRGMKEYLKEIKKIVDCAKAAVVKHEKRTEADTSHNEDALELAQGHLKRVEQIYFAAEERFNKFDAEAHNILEKRDENGANPETGSLQNNDKPQKPKLPIKPPIKSSSDTNTDTTSEGSITLSKAVLGAGIVVGAFSLIYYLKKLVDRKKVYEAQDSHKVQ